MVLSAWVNKSLNNNVGEQVYLTLKVLVATIDALGHFETG